MALLSFPEIALSTPCGKVMTTKRRKFIRYAALVCGCCRPYALYHSVLLYDFRGGGLPNRRNSSSAEGIKSNLHNLNRAEKIEIENVALLNI